MYRATADVALMEKATYLMREWAKAATQDGEYFPNRRNLGIEHSHYIFDKTVCGLVDMCLYGGKGSPANSGNNGRSRLGDFRPYPHPGEPRST